MPSLFDVRNLDVAVRSVRGTRVVGKISEEVELDKFANVPLVTAAKGELMTVAKGFELGIERVSLLNEDVECAGHEFPKLSKCVHLEGFGGRLTSMTLTNPFFAVLMNRNSH